MAIDFLKLAHLNSEARKALANLRLIEKERDRLVGDTRKLADSLKREQITLALSQLPVERLREVGDIRVPVEALRRHGLVNVGDIYSRSTSFIGALSGISPTTAYELKEVVEKMADAHQCFFVGACRTSLDFNCGWWYIHAGWNSRTV